MEAGRGLMTPLTIKNLKDEAKLFAIKESKHEEKSIYGITDGKAVGTYLEHKFQIYLEKKYSYIKGNSAHGIDFPELEVDMKVTSIKQPQSSCPFKSAEQKIYGLGYSLLVFVYDKEDNRKTKTAKLDIKHTIFAEKSSTADYQMTSDIIRILNNNGNKDDLIGLFSDRNLPIDEIGANDLAEKILKNRPSLGYLTISNALQWRLQYGRIIEKADQVNGIERIV
jgi:hypothetical protein